MTLLAAALQYGDHGLPVFPIHTPRSGVCTCDRGEWCESPGKHPRVGGGFKAATTDQPQIHEWWTRWPDANIGLATGKSANIVVLDVDGPEGAEAVRGRHLPPTAAAQTGRGIHYFFACPEGGLPSRVGVLSKVDLRGDGGYVVVPPSLHVSGQRYRWVPGLTPRKAGFAPCPGWVRELALEQSGARPRRSVEEWRSLAAEGVSEGERHNRLASMAGKLIGSGLDPDLGKELLHAWNDARCRPPLPRNELVQIIDDIQAREYRGSPESSPRGANKLERAGANGLPEWEPPVEFDGFSLPPFPTEALPPVIRIFVEELTASHQVPIDIPACAGIGAVAAALARKVEVAIGESHRETINLYIAPTAPSGERKRVIRDLLAPLYEAERALQSDKRSEISKAQGRRAIAEEQIRHLEKRAGKEDDPAKREALACRLDRLRMELPEVPAVPQLIADDTTSENLGRILAEQGERIAIVSEEAGSLFAQAAGRYLKGGEVDLDLWLKGYDGGSTRVGRVTRKAVSLERPAITAIVTPQPIVLAEFAKHPEFVGRGFVARWLFVLPSSLVGTRRYTNRPVSVAAREAYHSAIRRLVDLALPDVQNIPLVRLEGEALRLWATYQDQIEAQQADGGRLYFVRDWASKLAGKIARIAACFHLLEHRHSEAPWRTPISEEAVAAAWALGEYFTEHALAAHALMGADPRVASARRILGWIRRMQIQRFSGRDCHQAHRNVGKPSDLDPGLAILKERGFIRRLPAPGSSEKGGRPRTPDWEVNPRTQNPQKTQNPRPDPGSEGSESFEERSYV